MEGVFTQVVGLFVLVIVGYVAARLRIIGPEFNKQMSSFVILISSPCLILGSVMGDTVPSPAMIAPLLLVGMLSYAVLAALAVALSRLFTSNRNDRGIYSFMLTFGNVGFIGYPVVAAIYGPHAIFYACIVNFAFTVFAFTVGMHMVKGGHLSFDWHVLVSPNPQREELHDAYSIFSYHMRFTYDLMQKLLSFGPTIEVLRPREVRMQIAQKLKEACQHYES